MSELKAETFYLERESGERYAVEFYIKSEADKVIVKLKKTIAAVWMIALCLCAIGGDEVACILGIVMTLASAGLLLYRFGELVKFFAEA